MPPSGILRPRRSRNPNIHPQPPEQDGNLFPFCVQAFWRAICITTSGSNIAGFCSPGRFPGPSLDPRDKRLAMRVEDHPFDYRNFEGVIPSGYGAGIVMLWDRGTWKPDEDDIDAALDAGELKFQLDGLKLKGSWVLVRTKGNPRGEGETRSWLLIKHRDKWAGPIDVTKKAPDSVQSFGGFADILTADDPAIWQSQHRPAEEGDASKNISRGDHKATKIKIRRGKRGSVKRR